jgi:hypothetical protein
MRTTTTLRAAWMRTAGQRIVQGRSPTAAEISNALQLSMLAPRAFAQAPRQAGERRAARAAPVGPNIPVRPVLAAPGSVRTHVVRAKGVEPASWVDRSAERSGRPR